MKFERCLGSEIFQGQKLSWWSEVADKLGLPMRGAVWHMQTISWIRDLRIGGIKRNLGKEDFVRAIYGAALNEEQRSGVPAAITTAQAVLETGYGRSVPVDIDTGEYS